MAGKNREPILTEDKRALSRTNLKNLLGIFRFILPYKWSFLLGILSLLLSSITLLSFPYFAGILLTIASRTSSLDAKSEELVQQALEKLMNGRTTLIIAHRLSTIKKVDRIFVIYEGKLAEMGSPLELTQIKNGIYSTLLKLQLHEG